MTAPSFGRKGGIGIAAAPRPSPAVAPARTLRPASLQVDAQDELEARRLAFLAEERARRDRPQSDPDLLRPRETHRPGVVGPRSMVLTYMLWFVLGSVGAHRFYLGRNTSGTILAILTLISWGLIAGEQSLAYGGAIAAGLWVFVDGFLIKSMHRQATGKA